VVRVPAVARRVGWGLADQALSSGTNFALAVLIARAVTKQEFGAFGVAFTVYLLVQGLTRAVTSEPLLVRHSETDDGRVAAGRSSTGAALVVGAVAGALVVTGGLSIGGLVGRALVPLGLFLPALMAQDALRFVLIADRRPRAAAANDLVWAVAQLAAVGVLVSADRHDVALLVGAWGASATVATLYGVTQLGGWPRPRGAVRWWRSQRDLAPAFVGEFAARSGARQLTMYVLGFTGGLAALAAIRGAQVLFGPVQVALLSVNLLAVPELVRLRGRAPHRLPLATRALSLCLATAALGCGLLALAVPDGVGTWLLGATWADTRPVLLPQAALLAALGATSGALAGLRALGAADRSFRARLLIVPLSVAGGVVGSLVGGARGANWGLAAANAMGAAVFWWQFERAWAAAAVTRLEQDRPAVDAGRIVTRTGTVGA
jgi:O-antigen/teichoic acid export membrane protein